MKHIELSKLKVKLTLELSDLQKEKQRLIRVMQNIKDIEEKLILLESCPDDFLRQEIEFKRIENYFFNLPVSSYNQLTIYKK